MRFGCAAAGVAALMTLAVASPVLGQDPPTRLDSLEVVPDSVREVFQDTTPPRGQRFPERLVALRGPGQEVFVCERECVASSTSFSLLALLLEVVPGMTGVRGGFFAGPQYGFDGPFGPGFVSLYIDGREIASLEAAQTDLRRLSLNYVERVRVFRAADGLIIDVDLLRHDATRAYSRIGGGTGSPNADILEGVFANGLGRTFTFEGSFELLDVTARGVENDRFGAQGRVSWMPKSNDFGVQMHYRTESIDRFAVDTADVRRNELVLRTRANLGSRAQFEAYAQRTAYRLLVPGLPDSIPEPQRDANGAGLRLSMTPGNGVVTAGIRWVGGDAYARTTDVSAWYPVGPLTLEGGAELQTWNEFSTRSLRAGLAYADTILFPITIRGFAAAGDRGIGFPALIADSLVAGPDSVGFGAYGASVDLEVGPFDLSGRLSGQRLDRQVGFGVGFDRAVLVDSSEVDIRSLEARIEGPLIPVGVILPGLAPIRVRASWRQNTSNGVTALFVPERLARVDLTLHDTFFDDNLEIWLTGFLEHRGARLLPVSGAADPVLIGSDSWTGGHFMFKIGDFRFFWRLANLGGSTVADIPGANFPAQINLFGLRWEFFN